MLFEKIHLWVKSATFQSRGKQERLQVQARRAPGKTWLMPTNLLNFFDIPPNSRHLFNVAPFSRHFLTFLLFLDTCFHLFHLFHQLDWLIDWLIFFLFRKTSPISRHFSWQLFNILLFLETFLSQWLLARRVLSKNVTDSLPAWFDPRMSLTVCQESTNKKRHWHWALNNVLDIKMILMQEFCCILWICTIYMYTLNVLHCGSG